MVLLIVTCLANGAGGLRRLHSIGRSIVLRRRGSARARGHLLTSALRPSIVVNDRRECGSHCQDADTARNQQPYQHTPVIIRAGITAAIHE